MGGFGSGWRRDRRETVEWSFVIPIVAIRLDRPSHFVARSLRCAWGLSVVTVPSIDHPGQLAMRVTAPGWVDHTRTAIRTVDAGFAGRTPL